MPVRRPLARVAGKIRQLPSGDTLAIDTIPVGATAGTVAAGNDGRLSDAREWTADTVAQAEAEAGTATTRRAWTAQRVRQAITAWWTSIANAVAITGGTINGTSIGASTAAAGKFTTLEATGVITAAAGQIKFPATQNASSDANTLDDYEEGTWTPVLRDASAGNAATTTQSAGFYTKVGNLVHVRARLVGINTTGLTAGTQLYISGLPYGTNSAATQDHLFQVVRVNTSSAGNSSYGAAANNTTALALSHNTATGRDNMVAAHLVSGSSHLYISGTYTTN